MELQEIKEQTCRECGSAVTSESKRYQHCNGHWNEERVFSCGAVIRFSPNFMMESNSTLCPNSAKEKKKKINQNAAHKRIKLEISNLNCDERYKDRILDAIRHLNY